MKREMTGAKMVVQALRDQGVDTVFGYPGGAVLPIYDEVFQQNDIRHILVRHEQGAVHAAEGYARSTGRPGVVLVTSGPGATNAVTGLTDALMDSIPIVVLSGQVPTFMIGSDAFQEADTVGITRPCTKHNWLVKDTDRLPVVIVPTKYYATPTEVFRSHGFSLIIWANHLLRAAISAMQQTAQTLASDQNLFSVEDRVVPVAEVFRLQGAVELQ